MIIGLTGKNASGKGEIANYLKAKNFIYYSLSDVIRDEATKRGLEHSRDNLIMLGNELRERHAPNYLAVQINEKIKIFSSIKNISYSLYNKKIRKNIKKNPEQNFVVDSIRSPFEAKELMKNKSFTLLGIKAPIEIRFKRMIERGRIGDAKTVEDLKRQEERENTTNKSSQQLDATFSLFQKVIINDGTLEELHAKIDKLLRDLS